MKRRLALLVIVGSVVFTLGAVTVVNLATQVTGLLPKTNGGTGISSTATFPSSGTVTITVASGTTSLGTSAIASGACATVVTATATGTTTSDTISFSLSAAPNGTNMYSWLEVLTVPTANTANFYVCNNSAASRTPTAMSAVWHVYR